MVSLFDPGQKDLMQAQLGMNLVAVKAHGPASRAPELAGA